MILFGTPPCCFVILSDKFGSVGGMRRNGFLLEMKPWLHKAIASRKAVIKWQVRRRLMTLRFWWGSGKGLRGIRNWKRQEKRSLQAERGISCWNHGWGPVEWCWGQHYYGNVSGWLTRSGYRDLWVENVGELPDPCIRRVTNAESKLSMLTGIGAEWNKSKSRCWHHWELWKYCERQSNLLPSAATILQGSIYEWGSSPVEIRERRKLCEDLFHLVTLHHSLDLSTSGSFTCALVHVLKDFSSSYMKNIIEEKEKVGSYQTSR